MYLPATYVDDLSGVNGRCPNEDDLSGVDGTRPNEDLPSIMEHAK